jgi:hypothetical protein
MAFESLSYKHTIQVANFPQSWLPLIHLYDPDLPLFPIYYFHVLPGNLPEGQRPSDTQRAFGYVEKINLDDQSNLKITLVLNKNLSLPVNNSYINPVRSTVLERFGFVNPVRMADIQNTFSGDLENANNILREIWHRVVSNAYGNILPFGKLWDEVMGLTRFVSSWNPPGGRKSELIQTHYFVSRFGERIQSAGGINQLDFFLLPNIQELVDTTNPLTSFPKYSRLVNVANIFQQNYCDVINVGGINLSKFKNPAGGKFNTAGIQSIFEGVHMPHHIRSYAKECFNAFDKGPQRTVIFFMMLDDIRQNRLNPSLLTPENAGAIYDGLAKTYQSPKAITIYAQQCFGNSATMPIDIWVKTFMKWPLAVYPLKGNSTEAIFANSQYLGKAERLIWLASQARKVHSSACDDALWCMKYASNRAPRGANPFSCNICLNSIRNVCPAFQKIRNNYVVFNTIRLVNEDFEVRTSAGNNNTPNQSFVSCEGRSIYSDILDDFSPYDNPSGFAPYPAPNHNGERITVQEFISIY